MTSGEGFRCNSGDWHLLQSVLIEVVHFSLQNCESVIGASKVDLKQMLHNLQEQPKDADLVLNSKQVIVFRNALRHVLQKLGYWEFETRTGYFVEEAQTMVERLNNLLTTSTESSPNSELFLSEWLRALPLTERIRALALIGERLTIQSREYCHSSKIPEERSIMMLHGLCELSSKCFCQIADYGRSESRAYPTDVLSKLLFEIADQYKVVDLLETALEIAKPKESGNLRRVFRARSEGGK